MGRINNFFRGQGSGVRSQGNEKSDLINSNPSSLISNPFSHRSSNRSKRAQSSKLFIMLLSAVNKDKKQERTDSSASNAKFLDPKRDFRSWLFYKRISLISLFSAILAFLIIDGAYFGIPRLYEHEYLHIFSLPTLSCRFLEGNVIDCYIYRLQLALEVGWEMFYTNIAIFTLVYLILALAFGRYWCGWVCPFGLAQRLISGLRMIVGVKPRRMPEKWRHRVDRLKYVVLFMVLLLSLAIGIPALGLTKYAFRISEPLAQFGPVHGFWIYLQMLVGLEPTTYVVPIGSQITLVVAIIAIFLMRNAYCRICPVGALLGLISPSSAVSIEKDHRKCTKCGICYRACPVDIKEVYEEDFEKHVMTRECIMCLRCVELCPQEDCLKATMFGRTLTKSRAPPKEVNR